RSGRPLHDATSGNNSSLSFGTPSTTTGRVRAASAAGRAVANVVQVRSEHHIGVLQYGIASFDHAHDAMADLFGDLFVAVIDVDGDPARQGSGGSRLAFFGFSTDVVECRSAQQGLEESLVGCELRCNNGVDSLNRREVRGRGRRASASTTA